MPRTLCTSRPAGRKAYMETKGGWVECAQAIPAFRIVPGPTFRDEPGTAPRTGTPGCGPIVQYPAYVLRAINPGVRIDSDDVPQVAPADNVVASHPARTRAPRQIAPAIAWPSIAELLEAAIAIRGERAQERQAA